ncbi:MAG: hypothetical protein R3314_05240 [Longimicrobiales bacterium]|nr:hypothetical protein [Longimicrobiales bacterium]
MASLRDIIHEIHRRSLWQVLGIYVVASWIIYQVVLALFEGIGLPSWVPGTALVLLLVGLPIVLATAFVQEGAPGAGDEEAAGQRIEGLETTADTVADRPSIDAPDAATRPASPDPDDRRAPSESTSKSKSLFTWSKAITGGVLAFAALGLAAAGFMGMRALGIGPAATLISSGELEGRTRVLVADLDSPPADSMTAYALTEALRIDLSGSEALAVVDPEELGPALRRMERAPDTRLTEDVARELAVREGIPVVLTGDLTPVGSGYQITARLLRPDSSRVLLRVREEAEGPDDVLAAVDALAERLRERTGESLRSIRSSERLAAYTTSSLDALKLYSQAVRAAEAEDDNRKAEALLESAIREDSTFAMAWRKLGAVRGNAGDQTGAVEAYRRAFELSDRLPESERLKAAASYYTYVEYDPAQAIDARERLLEIQPDAWGTMNNLALLYASRGEFQRAAELTARSVAAESTAINLQNLAGHALAAGDTATARSAFRARRRLYPGNVLNPALERQLTYATGDIDGVRANIDSVLSADPRPRAREMALWDRALLEFRSGRIEDATRTVEERREVRAEAGMPVGASALNLAFVHWFATGDTVEARQYADRFVDQVLPRVPELDRPYLPVAGFYALIGDVERARELVGEWERVVPPGMRRRDEANRRWVMGFIALAEGREEEALEHLRSSVERTGAIDQNRFMLAWAYDRAGRADSALAVYHRFEEDRHGAGMFVDAHVLGFVYERLGGLHEERGDTALAAEYYAKLVDLWADADPELQPRVDAARRALERLSAEGSG